VVFCRRTYLQDIRELMYSIINTRPGCNIGGMMMNILAYADDIVLLAPSSSLLLLLNVLLTLHASAYES
jgi:hypothetical protein